jgi:hypothetical protein
MPKYTTLGPVRHGGKILPIGSTVELSDKDGRDLERLGAVKAGAGGGNDAAPGAIPANFPGAVALADAGITTFDQLKAKTAEELGTIKGIGEATLKKLLAAIPEA